MSLMAIPATRNFLLIYLGVGIVLYFVFGLWHSKLGKSGALTLEAELAAMGSHPPLD
jgi:hypothetical protein